MKAERIFLQPYDNLDSVLDKMRQIYYGIRGTTQLRIFFAKRGKMIHDPLDFARIRNRADQYGFQLVFITTDPILQKIAREQQIAVYSEESTIPKNELRTANRLESKRSISQRMIKITALREMTEQYRASAAKAKFSPWLALVFLILFASTGLLFSHRATVTLPTTPFTKRETRSLRTNNTLESVTINGGVPSSLVYFSITKAVTIPSTGIIHSTPKIASGSIEAENQCDKAITIPAGSPLTAETDQTEIARVVNRVRIEAGEKRVIPFEAIQPGETGNFPPETLRAFASTRADCVSIVQITASAGGTEGIYPTPTDTDYQQAAATIHQAIIHDMPKFLEKNLSAEQIPLLPTVKIEQITEEQITPAIGYRGAHLTVKQKLSISVRVLQRDDLEKIAHVDLPNQANGSFFQRESTQFSIKKESFTENVESHQISFDMNIEQTGTMIMPEKMIQNLIAGKSESDAIRLLKEQSPENMEPIIHFFPSWARWLPWIERNIWIHRQ